MSHAALPVNPYSGEAGTNHRLHGGARDHELHLLSQHGGRRLLLDQVVSPVYLQLGLQVSRRVEVFAVLSCASALDKNKEAERQTRSLLVKSENLRSDSMLQMNKNLLSSDNKPDCEQVVCLVQI